MIELKWEHNDSYLIAETPAGKYKVEAMFDGKAHYKTCNAMWPVVSESVVAAQQACQEHFNKMCLEIARPFGEKLVEKLESEKWQMSSPGYINGYNDCIIKSTNIAKQLFKID